MSAVSASQRSAQAVASFQRWQSDKKWHPDPAIDQWGLDMMSALQTTLRTIAKAQMEIAEQVDQNTYDIQQLRRLISGE